MSALNNANHLTLDVDSDERFDPREFSLEEGLNSLFSIDIVATSNNPAIDFEQLIGKDASFTVKSAKGGEGATAPKWSGIISELHQIKAEDTGLSTYHLTLVPKMWLLTQRINCRIFQQQTDLEVAKSLLDEWNLSPVDETSKQYKPRKYRVQYQESDHAFVSRLLEASGISYFFRRKDGETKLVLTDTPEAGERRKQPLEHFNTPTGTSVHATNFRASRAVRSGKVTFGDHDHRLPNTPLLGEATTSKLPLEQKLEHYSYTPGSFRFGNKGPKDTPFADDRGRTRTDPDEAQRIADQASSAKTNKSRRFGFDSSALDLAAGGVLAINGHPLAEKEGDLLVTRMTMSGASKGEIGASLSAVSAKEPFKPEAVTPIPSNQGVEAATVVGPAGETIHTDEFGRVRVQFHWDRYGKMDENSSCWIPVNQPWAGDAYGSLNLPRIGQEVMVSYLGGNLEEPVIVGRMFTNLLRPAFPMPQNKTQSGFRSSTVPANGGYNELMFEDKQGSELVRARAEKDMTTRVNNDQSLSVGRHRSDTIEGNDKEAVQGDQSHNVDGNKTTSIGKDQLSSILGNLTSMAGGDRIDKTVGGATSEAASHQITSEKGTTLSVGSSMIYIGPDSITIQCDKLLLNPGKSAAASQTIDV